MDKILIVAVISSMLLGCQSTKNNESGNQGQAAVSANATYSPPPADSYFSIETDPNNLSSELEGTQHKIWKEAAYIKIRKELHEGEVIVFKNVEAKIKSDGGYYYLGNIYSREGELLFDSKYSLPDVGVYKFEHNDIVKTVDREVINTNRGVIYHGVVTEKEHFSDVYWKSTGGESPEAIPVRDYKSKKIHKVAERYTNGLHVSCVNKNVYIGFDNAKNIYAANGESIVVSVTYPYSSEKLYSSKSVGFTGVILKVDRYIERILLEEDAIKLSAFSKSNKRHTYLTSYNNGLAEAYSRVKSICSK